jgi:hypothetical protein
MLLADILQTVRTLQIGRLTIDVHAVGAAAQVMSEVQDAARQRLGTRTLKDLIGLK